MKEIPLETSPLIVQRRMTRTTTITTGASSPLRPWSMYTRVASIIILLVAGVVVMVVGWKTRSIELSSQDLDTQSFDRIFHTWEADLYKRRTQIAPPPMLGRSAHSHSDPLEEPGELIYLNHSKAFRMIQSTRPSLAQHFFLYQQGWDAQMNQAYCGVASAMAVLNSLRGKITLPQDPIYDPHRWATQPALIQSDCVRETLYDIDKMQHVFWGLGLDMATTLLNCHLQGQGYSATAHHIDPTMDSASSSTALNDLRSVFLAALEDDDTRLVVNYDRGGITQEAVGYGHFSPIGAYNYEMDAFLIMDVAKYKFPPVWVPTSYLLRALGTMDPCASFIYPDQPFDIFSTPMAQVTELLGCKPLYRGYILITKDDSI